MIFEYSSVIWESCWTPLLALHFLCGFLRISVYTMMSFKNRNHFTSLFLCKVPFISFSCPNPSGLTFTTMLNRISESGHLYCVSNLRGNVFSLSPSNIVLGIFCSVLFLKMPFLMGKFLICWHFYHEMVLDFVKSFFCMCCNNYVVFILWY